MTLSRRAFLGTLAALLATPTAAQTAPSTRSWGWRGAAGQVVRAPFTFTSVAVSSTRPVGGARVRASADGTSWSEWLPVTTHEQHGHAAPNGRWFGDLVTVPAGTLYVEVGADASIDDLRLDLIDSASGPAAPSAIIRAGLGTAVPIIPRAEWGCDERYRFDSSGREIWPPERRVVEKVVVHHTATSDGSTSNAAAVVRSIYFFHAVTQGWGDIGYNYLVDRNGNVYEGRYGGPGVEAGHAYGHNPGSIGIACIGTYSWEAPSAAMRTSLARLIAQVAPYLDPHDGGWFVDGDMPNLMGHRDAMQYRPGDGTECPGSALYGLLPGLRGDVAFNLPQPPKVAAAILEVRFDPPAMTPGATFKVSVTLKNTGTTTLTTQGPPGLLVYGESENSAGRGYGDRVGSWRMALELTGGGAASGYPFRWGFAEPLEPGKTAVVEGQVRVNGPGPRNAAVGLVRESRYWHLRGVGSTTLTVVDPARLTQRLFVPDARR